jgi:hypothetical protein
MGTKSGKDKLSTPRYVVPLASAQGRIAFTKRGDFNQLKSALFASADTEYLNLSSEALRRYVVLRSCTLSRKAEQPCVPRVHRTA